ncbi:MAG: DsbA family protein [Gemmatimonadales bacterium]|jgi:predicted DsbA family dithiol-disulfide isomerase|nr:MAG: DsbA family protein [Gemmatimonadales bacterium]
MFRVRIYLDYIDPGSFLMDRRLGALEMSMEITVERLPWEVRRPSEPMLAPSDAAWVGYWTDMARQAREEGFSLVRPDLVPRTRKAHELALLSREKGYFDKVHRALMEGFHLQGHDLGRVDVLVELGRAQGLDLTEVKAVLDVDRHAETLDRIRDEAGALGVRGVPTLVAGPRVLEGVHRVDALREFLIDAQREQQED